MLISHIVQLYTLLKNTVHCPKCQKLTDPQEIELVDLCDEECTFALYCPDCDITIDADILMYDGSKPSIQLSHEESVTEEDIEYVTKSLSTHKGSLKQLLENS